MRYDYGYSWVHGEWHLFDIETGEPLGAYETEVEVLEAIAEMEKENADNSGDKKD